MREYQIYLSFWDIVLPPLYLLIILIFGYFYQQSKIRKHPEYKYFLKGLVLKIFGGIAFACIYLFYYDGGDTTLYYDSCLSLLNMAGVSLTKFLGILAGNLTAENKSLFSNETGWPYYYNDFQSYSVVRFSSLFVFLGARSFITATILVSSLTYLGMWQLFKMLYNQFKESQKSTAFALLFIPSTIFWGSGILKDSYTLMAACLMVVSLYKIFVYKQRVYLNVLLLIVSFYILVSLKPYIFFAIMAAFVVAMSHQYIKVIKNKVVKTFFVPVIIVLVVGIGAQVMIAVGESVGGQYRSVDMLLYKASATQLDLTQSYYHGNSFDIGKFEPTVPGVLSKAPVAIMAGLYRPYLWDSRNPVMLISALENSLYLGLTLYLLLLSFIAWRKKGLKFLGKILFYDSFIVFSLTFALLFSFSVGISTANFGALVRYKIPLIPFFLTTLFFLISNFNREKATINKLTE